MDFTIKVDSCGDFTRDEVRRLLEYVLDLGLEGARAIVEDPAMAQHEVTWSEQALSLTIHSPKVAQ
jgi:hypothetical protein